MWRQEAQEFRRFRSSAKPVEQIDVVEGTQCTVQSCLVMCLSRPVGVVFVFEVVVFFLCEVVVFFLCEPISSAVG